MGMRDNSTSISQLCLGPSLLPAGEPTQTRQQRRSVQSAHRAAAQVEAVGALNNRIAVRVGDIQLRGIAHGIRPEQLRHEVSKALRSMFNASQGRIQAPQAIRPLESGANVEDVAKVIAATVMREAAQRQESTR